jgi:sulfur carrier protein ThiS
MNAEYNDGKGVDIRSKKATIEVETPETVADALGQLRGHQGPTYIAGTNKEAVNKALEITKGTTVGCYG